MGATPMSGMHHPQQIARLVDPARRERPALSFPETSSEGGLPSLCPESSRYGTCS